MFSLRSADRTVVSRAAHSRAQTGGGQSRLNSTLTLSPGKSLSGFPRVEIHMIAHVPLGGPLQRLVVPRKIDPVPEGGIGDAAASLALPDLGIEPRKIPARVGFCRETTEMVGIRRVRSKV